MLKVKSRKQDRLKIDSSLIQIAAKYCSSPPPPPANGKVIVKSEGLVFSSQCQGLLASSFTAVTGGSGCDSVDIKFKEETTGGSFNTHTYILRVTPSSGTMPGLGALLTFSMAVSPSSVTVTLAVSNQSKTYAYKHLC